MLLLLRRLLLYSLDRDTAHTGRQLSILLLLTLLLEESLIVLRLLLLHLLLLLRRADLLLSLRDQCLLVLQFPNRALRRVLQPDSGKRQDVIAQLRLTPSLRLHLVAQPQQLRRVIACQLHYAHSRAVRLPFVRNSDRMFTTGVSTVSSSTEPPVWPKPMLTSGSISPNTLNIDVTYAATDVTSGATTCDAPSTYLRLTPLFFAYW